MTHQVDNILMRMRKANVTVEMLQERQRQLSYATQAEDKESKISTISNIRTYCDRPEPHKDARGDPLEVIISILQEVDGYLNLDFNWRELAAAIVTGKSIIVNGAFQGGKTGVLPVAHLCGCILQRPVVLQSCVSESSANQLHKKYLSMVGVINGSSFLKKNHVTLQCKNLPSLKVEDRKELLFGLRNDRHQQMMGTGVAALFITFIQSQIEMVHEFLQKRSLPACIYVIDECDKNWNSQAERRHVQQDSYQGLKISKRELNFYSLARRQCPSPSLGPRSLPSGSSFPPGPLHSLFPGVHSLVQVSATNVDTLAWHLNMRLPFTILVLDDDAIREKGYVGKEKLAPLRDSRGQYMFHLKSPSKQNDYGFETREFRRYLEVIKEASQDPKRQGILALDISSNRVHAEGHNLPTRAGLVAAQHPDWIVLYVHQEGVFRAVCRRGQVEHRVVKEFGKSGGDTEAPPDLSEALAQFDHQMSSPVYLAGYQMIRRSVSTRSSQRVVTHAHVAPSSYTSLTDLLQMVGRCYGRCHDRLKANGFEDVTVLMRREDYVAVQSWDDYVHHLLAVMEEKKPEDLLHFARARFPTGASGVLKCDRRLGNKEMNTNALKVEVIDVTGKVDAEHSAGSPGQAASSSSCASSRTPMYSARSR